ncbi:MAG: tetratricopeptide repeat protein [Bacteroidota bacterium]
MKETRHILRILIIICFSSVHLSGQHYRTDSLFTVLQSAKNDSTRANLYNELGMEFVYDDPDSALYYFNKAVHYSRRCRDEFKEAGNHIRIAFCYENKGDDQMALQKYEEAYRMLEKYLKTGDAGEQRKAKELLAIIYNNMGNISLDRSDYALALEYYFKALKFNDEIGNKKNQGANLGNIGIVYKEQSDMDHALEYFTKAKGIAEEIGNKGFLARALVNIGVIYSGQGKDSLSLVNYLEALQIFEEIGDKRNMAINMANIGSYYHHEKNYNKAREYYFAALKLNEETNHYKDLALDYGSIGATYLEEGRYQLAEEYLMKAIKLGEEMHSLYFLEGYYHDLYNLYEKTGQTKKALDAYKKKVAYRDSAMSEENKQAVIRIEMQYQFEKKAALDSLNNARIIELKNLELKEQKVVSSKQRLAIIFIISGLILTAVFAVLLISRLRITRRQNRIIEKQKIVVDEKNELLLQQNAEIMAQRDEIEAQRDLVTRQKEELTEVYKELTDSIRYAKRIQNSALTDIEQMKQFFADVFVFFRPKDVVSGDFYWFAKVEDKLVFSVADCTGHGVPGGFMSMLGISLLKEIVVNEYITQPDVVLRRLRKELIRSLGYTGKSGEPVESTSGTAVNDGMDISLCCLHMETMTLQWAGANNPLLIVGKENVRELKPDKMPVGMHVKMDKYTLHEMSIEKGTMLYLWSDGFQDQFGGEDGKKYMARRFREYLISLADKHAGEQEALIGKTLGEWMKVNSIKYDQTDDITIMGIRI